MFGSFELGCVVLATFMGHGKVRNVSERVFCPMQFVVVSVEKLMFE